MKRKNKLVQPKKADSAVRGAGFFGLNQYREPAVLERPLPLLLIT